MSEESKFVLGQMSRAPILSHLAQAQHNAPVALHCSLLTFGSLAGHQKIKSERSFGVGFKLFILI
jgi:hypothetical protein